MLNTFQPDKCCTKHMAVALHDAALEKATVWTCPDCGVDWKAEMVGQVKSWCPVVYVEVFH